MSEITKKVYLPIAIYKTIHFTWTQTNAAGNDILDFMHGLQIRKTQVLGQWIKNKKNLELVIDFYYKKLEIFPEPDMIPFEEAVKELMSGNIVATIGRTSTLDTFHIGPKYCYYNGKFYVNSLNGNIWNIRTGFFDFLSKEKFVKVDETFNLSTMKLRGVNDK